MTWGVHVGAIVVDEHDDEWIARSLAASTMGADAGRRGDEVVVNPPLNSRLVGPRLSRLLRHLADGGPKPIQHVLVHGLRPFQCKTRLPAHFCVVAVVVDVVPGVPGISAVAEAVAAT